MTLPPAHVELLQVSQSDEKVHSTRRDVPRPPYIQRADG